MPLWPASSTVSIKTVTLTLTSFTGPSLERFSFFLALPLCLYLLFFWREGCDIIPCLTHLNLFRSLIIPVTLCLFPFFLAGVSRILPEQPITFVLCLYFVLYPLYHSYHARTEVSSSE